MNFVIERHYRVTMFQHIIVEADNLEDACKEAVEGDYTPSGEGDQDDWNERDPGDTYVSQAKLAPAGIEVDDEDLDRANFMRDKTIPDLDIPPEFAQEPVR
jgi:hypothetical protein